MAIDFFKRTIPSHVSDELNTNIRISSFELTNLLHSANSTLQQIESYPGQNWDQLFGQTGLWKKSKQTSYLIRYLKVEVDYYRIFTSHDNLKRRILIDLLSEIKEIESNCSFSKVQLLKAKLYANSLDIDPILKSETQKQIQQLLEKEKSTPIYFQTLLLSYQIDFPSDEEFANTIESLEKNLPDDQNLKMRFALLAYRKGSEDLLKESLLQNTSYVYPISKLMLDKLQIKLSGSQVTIDQISNLSFSERELISHAIINASDPSKYKQITELFSLDSSSQPGYVSTYAQAMIQAEDSPKVSLKMMAEALQRCSTTEVLQKEYSKSLLAYKMAYFAYQLYQKTPETAQQAADIFELYIQANKSEKIDSELIYSFACDLSQIHLPLAKSLLKLLVENDTSRFARLAQLDLLSLSLEDELSIAQAEKNLDQLSNLLASSSQDDDICQSALVLYSQYILLYFDSDSAKISFAINLIDDRPQPVSRELKNLKTQLLLSAHHFERAISYFAQLLSVPDQQDAQTAFCIIWKLLEEYEIHADLLKSEHNLSSSVLKIASYAKENSPCETAELAEILFLELKLLLCSEYNEFEYLKMTTETSSYPLLSSRLAARCCQVQGQYETAAVKWPAHSAMLLKRQTHLQKPP